MSVFWKRSFKYMLLSSDVNAAFGGKSLLYKLKRQLRNLQFYLFPMCMLADSLIENRNISVVKEPCLHGS